MNKYKISSNIQGMFDLSKQFINNNISDIAVEDYKKLIEKFSPMKCNNCALKSKCNFVREIGVCNEFNVEIITDYGNSDRRY